MALLLAVSLAGASLPPPAAALSLPWRRPAQAEDAAIGVGRVMPPLQEVSPPEAVQQIQTALAARQPVVEIVSPAPDSLLPPGPWTLRLRVHDWPLVEGGPHLVVQLDQQAPQLWTRSEGVLPELSPGSHRLTVYAALPWGEARKNPGAVQQIRLHRGASNPPALPAPGSPQLLAVSPSGPAAREPLLLDWLLLDAPLQNVGGSGTQWRLRVTINGDAVLLDQQAPLWLRGWRQGLNALRLELLDGRGEPLNPPFNSLVQEVDLGGMAAAPRWQGGRLSASELAMLLGESTPLSPPAASPELKAAAGSGPERTPQGAAPSSATTGQPESPEARPHPLSQPHPPAQTESPQRPDPLAPPAAADARQLPSAAAPDSRLQGSTAASIEPPPSTAADEADSDPAVAAPSAASALQAQPLSREQATSAETAAVAAPAGSQPADARPPANEPEQAPPAAAAPQPTAAAWSTSAPAAAAKPTDSAAANQTAGAAANPAASATASAAANPPAAATPQASPDAQDPSMTAPAPSPVPQPVPPPRSSDTPARVRPSSELSGRARDLVNDDGTLRRPERRGPLAGLRERLQR